MSQLAVKPLGNTKPIGVGPDKRVNLAGEKNKTAYLAWENLSQPEKINAVKQMGSQARFQLLLQIGDAGKSTNVNKLNKEKLAVIQAINLVCALNISNADLKNAKIETEKNGELFISWGKSDKGSFPAQEYCTTINKSGRSLGVRSLNYTLKATSLIPNNFIDLHRNFGGKDHLVDSPHELNKKAYIFWQNLSQDEREGAVHLMSYPVILKLINLVNNSRSVFYNKVEKLDFNSDSEEYRNRYDAINNKIGNEVIAIIKGLVEKYPKALKDKDIDNKTSINTYKGEISIVTMGGKHPSSFILHKDGTTTKDY